MAATAISIAQETLAAVSVQSTWDSLCAGCHGQSGDGSDPTGVSLGARDLTDPVWQTSTTDEQIASSIAHGKGRMPAFSLPSRTTKELVSMIRQRSRANKNNSGNPRD